MNTRKLTPLLFAITLLAGCGSQLVRNQPPLAQVSSWAVDGEELQIELHLRNINEEPMPLSAVNLTITVDDVLLARHRQALDTTVVTSGFESVPLRMSVTAEGLRELRALENGERKSLTYLMEGSVTTTGNRNLEFRRDGHVFTVPGRPGQFR